MPNILANTYSSTIKSVSDPKIFGKIFLDNLVSAAQSSTRKRQHWNIHLDYSDCCQRLFNAIEPESYLRPHYHDSSQGSELLIGISGHLKVVFFDSQGNIDRFVDLVSYSDQSVQAAAVEIPAFRYHTVISLSPGSILLEVKSGPFVPANSKNFAHWAPEECSETGYAYLKELVIRVSNFKNHSLDKT